MISEVYFDRFVDAVLLLGAEVLISSFSCALAWQLWRLHFLRSAFSLALFGAFLLPPFFEVQFARHVHALRQE